MSLAIVTELCPGTNWFRFYNLTVSGSPNPTAVGQVGIMSPPPAYFGANTPVEHWWLNKTTLSGISGGSTDTQVTLTLVGDYPSGTTPPTVGAPATNDSIVNFTGTDSFVSAGVSSVSATASTSVTVLSGPVGSSPTWLVVITWPSGTTDGSLVWYSLPSSAPFSPSSSPGTQAQLMAVKDQTTASLGSGGGPTLIKSTDTLHYGNVLSF